MKKIYVLNFLLIILFSSIFAGCSNKHIIKLESKSLNYEKTIESFDIIKLQDVNNLREKNAFIIGYNNNKGVNNYFIKEQTTSSNYKIALYSESLNKDKSNINNVEINENDEFINNSKILIKLNYIIVDLKKLYDIKDNLQLSVDDKKIDDIIFNQTIKKHSLRYDGGFLYMGYDNKYFRLATEEEYNLIKDKSSISENESIIIIKSDNKICIPKNNLKIYIDK